MKKTIKFVIFCLLITTLILEGVNIYLSNKVAETSIEVAIIRQEIQELDEKTTSLKTELLRYSSFEYISSRAAELGFNDTRDNAIMIKTPVKVARVE